MRVRVSFDGCSPPSSILTQIESSRRRRPGDLEPAEAGVLAELAELLPDGAVERVQPAAEGPNP